MDWWGTYGRLMLAGHVAVLVESDIAARQEEQLSRLSDEISGYLAKLPEGDRDTARKRIGMLVGALDQTAIRWIVQGTLQLDPEEALDLLTDIWACQFECDPR